MQPSSTEIIHYKRWDTQMLYNFYLSLIHEKQQLENKMELVKRELDRRVKAEPLPSDYRPGSDVVSEVTRP